MAMPEYNRLLEVTKQEIERDQQRVFDQQRGRALLSYQRKLAMAYRIEKDIILPGSIPHLTSQYVFGFEQD